MPNCFSLTRIGDSEPTALDMIDRDLCQTFGIAYSPKLYACQWFDAIGFLLACGKSWDDIVDNLNGYITQSELNGNASDYREMDYMHLAFVHHLRQHYVANAWGER